MQFKRALAHMDTDFPFGGAFGVSDTREACVQCSQKLYDRLLLQENGVSGMLHFNAIALIAMDRNGNLDTEKTKDLIRIFRPGKTNPCIVRARCVVIHSHLHVDLHRPRRKDFLGRLCAFR
jgi:hypothetical protein